MVHSGRSDASQCGITIAYQRRRPNQIHHVFDTCRTLPNLTKIIARDAKPIGGFGLVVPLFTRAYQPADLALSQPCETFTNHYHRGLGQGIDVSV